MVASTYIVQPVLKALRVLEHVAEKGHEVTLTRSRRSSSCRRRPPSAISRRSPPPRSCAMTARDRYGVGLRFRALAKVDKGLQRLRTSRSRRWPNSAAPSTRRSTSASSATATSSISTWSRRTARCACRPASASATRAFDLARQGDARLPARGRPAGSPRAIAEGDDGEATRRKVLRRQIDEVRRRGYAVEVGENEDGSMCIGVPILDEARRPLAAISLSAPERRMTPTITAAAVAALQNREAFGTRRDPAARAGNRASPSGETACS